MSESLKKCVACDGTGDKKRRANIVPALKQQCPICRGEGMELDTSRWQEVLKKGGLVLRAEQDKIDVTTASDDLQSEPDPDWKFTDEKRHIHRWRFEKGDLDSAMCTTVKYVIDSEATDELEQEGHQECRRCGERVELGYVQKQQTIAGEVAYYVNEEEVGRRTFWVLANLLNR